MSGRTSVGTSRIPAADRTPEQVAAYALATEAADQLIDAESVLLAVPLYNFGVSQHLKTWIDLVITDPRMGASAEPVLAGKKAVLIIVRGGAYGPGTPRDGWDHSTAWIRRILEDVWRLDVRIIETEMTLAAVNPALAQFIDYATESRSAAEASAREHGRALAPAAV